MTVIINIIINKTKLAVFNSSQLINIRHNNIRTREKEFNTIIPICIAVGTSLVHPRQITNKATAIYERYWVFISVWETPSEQSRIYY